MNIRITLCSRPDDQEVIDLRKRIKDTSGYSTFRSEDSKREFTYITISNIEEVINDSAIKILSNRFYHLLLRPNTSKSIQTNQSKIFNWLIEIPIYESIIDKRIKLTLDMFTNYHKINFTVLKSSSSKILSISLLNQIPEFLSNLYTLLLSLTGPVDAHQARHEIVLQEIIAKKSRFVLELGCGKGNFITRLNRALPDIQICGIEINLDDFQHATAYFERQIHSGLISMVNDSICCFEKWPPGVDCITLNEVIEHLTEQELNQTIKHIFNNVKPEVVIITTPNKNYNKYLKLTEEGFRHPDHRFELSREEFSRFAARVINDHEYGFEILPHWWIRDGLESLSTIAIFTKYSCT
ncbi:methyltransferase domain-containing protein [Mucilaginibacter sp. KACC 22063]|uniref:methyltransferase domain-containing protein n=1 Tax=Mucilaginibacter sp. KACC 22063 TaxID=3025666 RepID=UPI0023657304|nr:methyltransferase domain-containing protein [Mucilaginibacter sp. KACC 22063]WDF55251.1 methyltransferase [Mucilaginibacter sp. KACC 22063]